MTYDGGCSLTALLQSSVKIEYIPPIILVISLFQYHTKLVVFAICFLLYLFAKFLVQQSNVHFFSPLGLCGCSPLLLPQWRGRYFEISPW